MTPPHPTQVEPLKRLVKIVNSFLSRADIGPFREPVDWRGLGLDDYPKIVKKMMDLGTVKRKLDRKQYYTATECADDIRLIWSNCMAYNADGSDFWLLAKSFARRFEDRYRKIRQEMDCGADLKNADDKSDSGGPSSSSKSKDSSGAKTPVPSTTSYSTNTPAKPIPLDVRAKFGANLFLLSGVELAHVILQLERGCPEALEHLREVIGPPGSNGSNDISATASDTNSSTHGSADGDNNSTVAGKKYDVIDPPRLEINVDAIPNSVFEELSQYVEARVGNKDGGGGGGGGSSSVGGSAAATTQPATTTTTTATTPKSEPEQSSSSSGRPKKKKKTS